jgi:type VI secretion system secreted protein VgrG
VTGRTYNADMMPPYELPTNQTQSGFKSRSTTKGDAKLFNELRFEDKKDKEHIYFHAERDFQRVVENNDDLEVGFKWKKDGNRKVKIHNNYELVVGNQDSADGSHTFEVYKDRTGKILEGNDKLAVSKGFQEIEITEGYGKTEAGEYLELIVGESSLKIEPDKITLTSATIVLDATGEIKAGAPDITIDGSAGLVLMGGTVKIN